MRGRSGIRRRGCPARAAVRHAGARGAAHRSGANQWMASGCVLVARLPLLRPSDHLVFAVPLTLRTENLLDPRVRSQVKPGVHLVNIARGRSWIRARCNCAFGDGQWPWRSSPQIDLSRSPAGHGSWPPEGAPERAHLVDVTYRHGSTKWTSIHTALHRRPTRYCRRAPRASLIADGGY